MRILETAELQSVAGGDSVESNLGAGVAVVLHGINSQEAHHLGLFSYLGWFVGAGVHYATNH